MTDRREPEQQWHLVEAYRAEHCVRKRERKQAPFDIIERTTEEISALEVLIWQQSEEPNLHWEK